MVSIHRRTQPLSNRLYRVAFEGRIQIPASGLLQVANVTNVKPLILYRMNIIIKKNLLNPTAANIDNTLRQDYLYLQLYLSSNANT